MYGGAVGWFHFNGDLNTGLILRTIHVNQGLAAMRVGATLLYDSIPQLEEEETLIKASFFMDLLQDKEKLPCEKKEHIFARRRIIVLLIDHQDSFVHTLANYVRQTGAEVTTVRYDFAHEYLKKQSLSFGIVISRPGCPSDFGLNQTINLILKLNIPIFGVCLGLQAIVEYLVVN